MSALLAALAAFLASAATNGPSFDCAKARTPDEHLVCEDAGLAARDRALAARFGARVARAGPDEAASLRRDQRAWLRERAACTRAHEGKTPTRAESIECAGTVYGWRLEDLDDRGVEKLPAGIVRMTIVRRDPWTGDRTEIAYPALAAGAAGAAFDAFFAAEARRLAGEAPARGADREGGAEWLDAGFAVPLETDRLVTVVTQGYAMSEGAAHGMPFRSAVTFDLARGKPLAVTDVFADQRRMVDALLPVALERALGGPPDADEKADAEERGRKVMGDVARWTFDAQGGVVTFPAYSIGPYAIGQPEARFTWAELAPHLKKDAPLPPRARSSP